MPDLSLIFTDSQGFMYQALYDVGTNPHIDFFTIDPYKVLHKIAWTTDTEDVLELVCSCPTYVNDAACEHIVFVTDKEIDQYLPRVIAFYEDVVQGVARADFSIAVPLGWTHAILDFSSVSPTQHASEAEAIRHGLYQVSFGDSGGWDHTIGYFGSQVHCKPLRAALREEALNDTENMRAFRCDAQHHVGPTEVSRDDLTEDQWVANILAGWLESSCYDCAVGTFVSDV